MSLRSAIFALTCLAAACGGEARPAAQSAIAIAGVTSPSPSPSPRSESAVAVAVTPPSPRSQDLEAQLRQHPRLAPLVERAAAYRMQVLVSVPAEGNAGWQRRDGFRVDAEYFYPASAIKLVEAVAALEAVTELRESRASGLEVGAGFVSESASKRRSGVATIANLVSAAIVISDNDASNDLLDLAGFDGLHQRMWRLGLSSVRIRHRLAVPSSDDARSTPRIELFAGPVPVVIAPREGRVVLGKNEESGVRVGESHLAAGRLVEEPMSFEAKNRVSLQDLQDLLVAVTRPELRGGAVPRLGERERSLLIESLTALPSARGLSVSADAEHKPLLAGIERVVPRSSLTVASKGGRAYGFVIDNAHVVDARTGRSFFMTATLHVNANGRMNDDLYEYREVALPALADLGELVARSVFEDPTTSATQLR
ncbi:MAG: hypothetical protein BGO98_49140 [Myxococcales bacterium 68-20]|nr:serine hydrolase [Myxococcales bacterium]OJY29790.1 MAG: hypothetical protein BGO98_49140 [Myxococcales bacterium 68-20]